MNKLGLTVLLHVADKLVPAIITAIKEKNGKEVVDMTAFYPDSPTKRFFDVEEGEGESQWQMPGGMVSAAKVGGSEPQKPPESRYPTPGNKE